MYVIGNIEYNIKNIYMRFKWTKYENRINSVSSLIEHTCLHLEWVVGKSVIHVHKVYSP